MPHRQLPFGTSAAAIVTKFFFDCPGILLLLRCCRLAMQGECASPDTPGFYEMNVFFTLPID